MLKISLVEPTTSSSRGERSTTLLLPVGENDLNLKIESIVGRVDHSGLDLEALGRDVGRRRDSRRHVDADVVDPAEAASTVTVLKKIVFFTTYSANSILISAQQQTVLLGFFFLSPYSVERFEPRVDMHQPGTSEGPSTD